MIPADRIRYLQAEVPPDLLQALDRRRPQAYLDQARVGEGLENKRLAKSL